MVESFAITLSSSISTVGVVIFCFCTPTADPWKAFRAFAALTPFAPFFISKLTVIRDTTAGAFFFSDVVVVGGGGVLAIFFSFFG